MSKKIGIVSEGMSDYYVLKHIVSRYLKEQDVYTIPLNPKQNKGKQIGFSGWQGVLNYISGTDEKNLFVCESINRCVNLVNKDIKKQGLFIDPDNKNSDGTRTAYDYILKQKRKPKEIKECSDYNYGFKKLIEQLDAIAAKEGMVTGENMGTI